MTTRETELLAANAALELEVARLRNALEVKRDSVESLMSWCVKNVDKWGFPEYDYLGYAVKKMKEVMSTQFTPTALNELIEKAEKKTIERCAEVHKDAASKTFSASGIVWADKFEREIRALPVGQIELEELL